MTVFGDNGEYNEDDNNENVYNNNDQIPIDTGVK
jgi:hypothetical protein